MEKTPLPNEKSGHSDGSGSSHRLRQVLTLAGRFFLGQGALQAINILIGLFLVRRLSVEHYAQFGLAFGFQVTASMLMDLGYASTIVPLVGSRFADRTLVGSYLRAAKHFRDKFFVILAPLAAVAFLAMMSKHHWSWQTQTFLVLSVLANLYASGPISYYAAPLFLSNRLREFYVPQALTALLRITLYIFLGHAGRLNACWAAGLLSANMLLNAYFLKRNARRLITWPESVQPHFNREMLRCILPAVPTFVFYAFQSQVALFLINAFGRTANVAEVAALGRIGQIFIILTSFNLVIVEPRVARLADHQVLNRYLLLLALPLALSAVTLPLAFGYPMLFISLIGRDYRNLSGDIGWVLLAACLNYAANLIWVMNRARKWIFWRGTIVEIVATSLVDVWFVAYVGVHSTRQAVLFTLASSICGVCVHGYIGLYGFSKTIGSTFGPRQHPLKA